MVALLEPSTGSFLLAAPVYSFFCLNKVFLQQSLRCLLFFYQSPCSYTQHRYFVPNLNTCSLCDTIFTFSGAPGPPTEGVSMSLFPLPARPLGPTVSRSSHTFLRVPQLTQVMVIVALSIWLDGPPSTSLGVSRPEPHLVMSSSTDP